MHVVRAYHRFEGWLEGWPSGALTVLLLLAAALLVLVAWRGNAITKAVVTGWVFFP